MDRMDDKILWGPLFIRNLSGFEEVQLFSLLDLLGQNYISEWGVDRGTGQVHLVAPWWLPLHF